MRPVILQKSAEKIFRYFFGETWKQYPVVELAIRKKKINLRELIRTLLSAIMCLFVFGCPSNIAFFVMTIYINAVKAVFRAWFSSDFRQKVFNSYNSGARIL